MLAEGLDAGLVAGVGAEEFGSGAGGGGGHLLPEGEGGAGVVAGDGHEDEPHGVGFAFLAAGEGHEDAVLGAEAEDGGGELLLLLGLSRGGGSDAEGRAAGLGEDLLAHAFVAMLGNGVGHFVAEDDGELVVVANELHEAFVDDDLAARHAPGVDLLVDDQVEFPLEVLDFVGETVVAEVFLGGGGD